MGKIKLEHDVGSTNQQIQRLKRLRFSIKKIYFYCLCEGFQAKIHFTKFTAVTNSQYIQQWLKEKCSFYDEMGGNAWSRFFPSNFQFPFNSILFQHSSITSWYVLKYTFSSSEKKQCNWTFVHFPFISKNGKNFIENFYIKAILLSNNNRTIQYVSITFCFSLPLPWWAIILSLLLFSIRWISCYVHVSFLNKIFFSFHS